MLRFVILALCLAAILVAGQEVKSPQLTPNVIREYSSSVFTVMKNYRGIFYQAGKQYSRTTDRKLKTLGSDDDILKCFSLTTAAKFANFDTQTYVQRCVEVNSLTEAEKNCAVATDPEAILYITICADPTCPTTMTNFNKCDKLQGTACDADSDCVSKNYQCEHKMNANYVTSVCSSCVNKVIGAYFTIVKNLFKQSQNTSQSLPVRIALKKAAMQADMGVKKFQIMRHAFCPMEAGTTEYCVNSLGILSLMEDDTYNHVDGVMQFLPQALVSSVCSVPKKAMCFRKVVGGFLEMALFQVRMMMTYCLRFSSYYTCQQQIGAEVLKQKYTFRQLGRMICTKNTAGSYCFQLPRDTTSTTPSFKSCVGGVKDNYCNSTCNAMFNVTLPTWGCCVRTMVIDGEGFMACADYNSVNASLPEACAIPRSTKKFGKLMKLKAAWDKIKNNATLQAQLKESLALDIATKIGVSEDDITNRQLSDASTATAPPTAAASRRLTTLSATGGTAFTFTLEAQNDAEAEAASTAFDTDQGSMTLTESTAQLQEAGVVTIDETATGNAPGAAPTSGTTADDGTSINIPLYAGIGGGALLLIIIVVVMVTRGGGKKNDAAAGSAPASNADYRNLNQL